LALGNGGRGEAQHRTEGNGLCASYCPIGDPAVVISPRHLIIPPF